MPVTIHAMAESDQILLGRMAKGDHGAFQGIYKKYAENLFVYAMGIFNHRETCEDILQNVIVHLWEKRNNNNTHLKPYLYQAEDIRNSKKLMAYLKKHNCNFQICYGSLKKEEFHEN